MFAIVSPDLFCHHAVCLGKGEGRPRRKVLGTGCLRKGPAVKGVLLISLVKSGHLLRMWCSLWPLSHDWKWVVEDCQGWMIDVQNFEGMWTFKSSLCGSAELFVYRSCDCTWLTL